MSNSEPDKTLIELYELCLDMLKTSDNLLKHSSIGMYMGFIESTITGQCQYAEKAKKYFYTVQHEEIYKQLESLKERLEKALDERI